jgi:hypothetical protein
MDAVKARRTWAAAPPSSPTDAPQLLALRPTSAAS